MTTRCADLHPNYVQAAQRHAKAILSALAATAKNGRCFLREVPRGKGPPDLSIIETAHAKGCDLIVMGSHGRSGL